ncbi:MAG TPA: carboxypeptidase-like regulatory domain-containing protein, partial [Longimicrobiales bacterium]|nr:carboxypeptidase-like regulatory domain-containing protein [Longimicrobiales bacterium]
DPEPRPPPPSSAGRSPTLEVDVAPQPRARRESPEAAGTPSWLRYALPTAAVAVLALGTSTLFMGDGVGSGTGVNPGGAGGEGAAGTDDPVAAGETPPDPPPGLLLAEVTLDGSPLAAVEVRLEASDGTVRVGTTGADGTVTFADVPPDTVRLTVRGTPAGTRLVESPGELVVGPGDTVRTTLRLQPGGA